MGLAPSLPTQRTYQFKTLSEHNYVASCFPSLKISAVSYFSVFNRKYLVPIYGQGRAFYSGLRICSGTPGIYTQWRPSLYRVSEIDALSTYE